MSDLKDLVKEYWNKASCGEDFYMIGESLKVKFEHQRKIRYELEPYIPGFAQFPKWKGKRVLEVGVGLGSDHQMFAEAGAVLSGIDLTPRAIDYTRSRLQIFGLKPDVQIADAENIPFPDAEFDLVYSWGVVQHTPNTIKAVSEIYRVLKPGGTAKIMVYHTNSMVGYMLWLKYGLFKLKPSMPLKEVFRNHLQGPGTKTYNFEEARDLFGNFSSVTLRSVLTHSDLLTSASGERHQNRFFRIVKYFYPRFIIRKFYSGRGLYLLADLIK